MLVTKPGIPLPLSGVGECRFGAGEWLLGSSSGVADCMFWSKIEPKVVYSQHCLLLFKVLNLHCQCFPKKTQITGLKYLDILMPFIPASSEGVALGMAYSNLNLVSRNRGRKQETFPQFTAVLFFSKERGKKELYKLAACVV